MYSFGSEFSVHQNLSIELQESGVQIAEKIHEPVEQFGCKTCLNKGVSILHHESLSNSYKENIDQLWHILYQIGLSYSPSNILICTI